MSTPSRPNRSLGNVSAFDRALTSAPRASQQLHHGRVVLGRRPHQRGLAELRLLAALTLAPGRGAPATTSALPVRAAVISTVWPRETRWLGVGAGREQRLTSARVAVERRPATAASRRSGWRRRAVAPACSSARRQVQIVGAHRPVQRRGAVGVGGVHFGRLLQQRAHGLRDRPPGSPPSRRRGAAGAATGATAASQRQRRSADASRPIRPSRAYAKKSSTRPSLSPKLSIRLPYWLAIASHRLPTGVCGVSCTCRWPLPTPPPTATHRQRVAGVPVRVAHAAAVDDQRVIEHRAVAVGQRPQLLEEPREQRHVIGVDLARSARSSARRCRGATRCGAAR